MLPLRPVLFGKEIPSEGGLHAKRAEVLLVHDFRLLATRLILPQRHHLAIVEREAREDMLRVAEPGRFEPGPGRVVARGLAVPRRRGDADLHESHRIAIRERPQEHRVDGAEDRRVGADA